MDFNTLAATIVCSCNAGGGSYRSSAINGGDVVDDDEDDDADDEYPTLCSSHDKCLYWPSYR